MSFSTLFIPDIFYTSIHLPDFAVFSTINFASLSF